MRRTEQAQRVAAALLDNPAGPHWGYQLGKQAHVRSGALYPILRRFHEAGWLRESMEQPVPALGRPARLYYTVTEAGRQGLAELAGGG